MTGIMMVTARVWTRGHWCWSPLVSGPGVGTHPANITTSILHHPENTSQQPAGHTSDYISHSSDISIFIFISVRKVSLKHFNILQIKYNIVDCINFSFCACESVAVLQNISIKSLCFGFKMQYQLTC